MKKKSKLASLPAVSRIISHPLLAALAKEAGGEAITHCARHAVDAARESLTKGIAAPSVEVLVQETADRVKGLQGQTLKRVINATGVMLHTNLGRAPMGKAHLDFLTQNLSGYCNLEFDLRAARRGKRDQHIAPRLAFLTGAPDAIVVNNNAAALILILNTFAKGREVIISRGELIEIGGEFRIPEILKASGALMVEVGTTNKTRLKDYASAISEKTALILKVHKSNYAIHGFTEEAGVNELAVLARKHKILCVYDIGSGLLRKVAGLDLGEEPDVRSAVAGGVHLVCFSADKLLGGPQAGIIAGETSLVQKLSRAPLMRALRVGKLILATLAIACDSFTKGKEGLSPVFMMLGQTPQERRARAAQLVDTLAKSGVESEMVESDGQIGGGSLPDLKVKSFAVTLKAPWQDKIAGARWSEQVFKNLLEGPVPVLGILRKGRMVFDVLALAEEEIPILVPAVFEAAKKANG
jgi:L-seryl-tRNA(Ser) seleniumtransferase